MVLGVYFNYVLFKYKHVLDGVNGTWRNHCIITIWNLLCLVYVREWKTRTSQTSQRFRSPVMTDNKSHTHMGVWVLSRFSRVRLFATLWIVARQALCPWNSPGKNTGEALLQEVFLTQKWNPHLLPLRHCRQILYSWATREIVCPATYIYAHRNLCWKGEKIEGCGVLF